MIHGNSPFVVWVMQFFGHYANIYITYMDTVISGIHWNKYWLIQSGDSWRWTSSKKSCTCYMSARGLGHQVTPLGSEKWCQGVRKKLSQVMETPLNYFDCNMLHDKIGHMCALVCIKTYVRTQEHIPIKLGQKKLCHCVRKNLRLQKHH